MVKRNSTLRTSGLGVADARLCLDFINTEGELRNDPPDRLEDLDLFFEWASRHGLVVPEGIAKAYRVTPEVPSEDVPGHDFLLRARELREALYGVFSAVVRNERPASDDVSLMNRELAEVLSQLRLMPSEDGVEWIVVGDGKHLEELLWPIVLSAADLLVSDLLDRVKECSSDSCSWMFLDESRNRSRRWCDMAECGNRAKARRFYQRHVKGGE